MSANRRRGEELTQAIRATRTAALIVNDFSRHGASFFQRAHDGLLARGFAVAYACLAHSEDDLRAAVRAAISAGHLLVVVGGGDGTQSAVVDDFAYRDAVLGLLPLGTGNSFARSVGIPLTLHGALDVITGGKVADVDLGRVGENYFANVVDIGLSATMARRTSRRLKRYLGKLAYVLVGMRELRRHRDFTCRFLIDGEREITVRTHEAIIANGSVYGTMRLEAEATIDDGRLLVITMAEAGRWQFLKNLAGFMLGRGAVRPAMHILYASEVQLDTDPPQIIGIDGEDAGLTPARFTIAPQALKLMTPLSFKDR